MVRVPLIIGICTILMSCTKTPDWSQVAKTDLEAIYQLILENHVGPVDSLNPSFKEWHEKAYQKLAKEAKGVKTQDEYRFLLKQYVAGFRDGHMSIGFKEKKEDFKWPGFVAAYRQGKVIVFSAVKIPGDPAPPEYGAEVVSCNGIPIKTFILDNIFPYEGIPEIESSWNRAAVKLFIDEGNSKASLAKECQFQNKGFVQNRKITWHKVKRHDLWPRIQLAKFGGQSEFRILEFGKGGLWINLPSFAPNEQEVAVLNKMIQKVGNQKNIKSVVFDVRGNSGGNSEWGSRFIKALYGPSYTKLIDKTSPKGKGVFTEWRVSPGNLETLNAYLKKYEDRFGKESEVFLYMQKLVSKMKQANETGQSLIKFPDEKKKNAFKLGAPPKKTKVFLLTDGRCASACLDFADKLLIIPGVTHIGQATSGDTLYMDGRVVDLPSKRADLFMAMKVYRNRKRAHNEVYIPKLIWAGEVSDTKGIRNWISKLLE